MKIGTVYLISLTDDSVDVYSLYTLILLWKMHDERIEIICAVTSNSCSGSSANASHLYSGEARLKSGQGRLFP
jgi:hypothetical protein